MKDVGVKLEINPLFIEKLNSGRGKLWSAAHPDGSDNRINSDAVLEASTYGLDFGLIAAGIVDIFLLDYVTDAAKVMSRMPFWVAAEIGDSIMLIFVAPLMLLLSYTREPRLKGNDILIPIAGIALIVIVVLQGFYQILAVSNIPPVDFQEIKTQLQFFSIMMATR